MEHALELTRQAEATHFWFQGFRSFVAPVLHDVAGGRRGLRLIDCGCGTGNNLALLRPYGSVFGFDLTSGGVTQAALTGRPVVRADVTRIPIASSSIDVVTSFDVLQSVPADADAVREMARIVKPGGTVILTVAAWEALRGDHAISWSEVHRYTPASVRGLVETAGLRVERMSFLFASLFPLIAVTRMFQRLTRSMRTVREDADIRVPSAPINTLLTHVVKCEARIARVIPMPIGSSLMVVARKIIPGSDTLKM